MVGLLLYFPTLFFNILNYEDVPFIIENKYINGNISINFMDFFIPNFISHDLYIPFTFIIYWLIIKIFGTSSFAFHFVNILFYIFSSIALYYLLKKIINNDLISFLATILYILHPCHVENTAWISAMGYNISSSFFFLSFLYFILAFDNKKLYYIYSVIFYILAILSQPVAVILPVILFLWIYCFRREILKESIKYFISYFFISIIYIYLSHNVINNDERFNNLSYSFLEKALILGKYLANSFLPLQTMPVYPLPSISFLIPLIVFFIVFLSIKKTNLFYFWFLWFVISILPYSSIFLKIEIAITDRYLILSSVASCVALSYFCAFIFNKFKNNNLLKYFVLFSILFIYSLISILYIPVWKDNKSLWTYAYSVNPESILVIDCYCQHILLNSSRYTEALTLADKIINKSPKLWGGYNLKIKTLMKMGNFKEALNVCLLYNFIEKKDYRAYLIYMFDIYLLTMNDYDNAEKSIDIAEDLYKKYDINKEDCKDIFREKKLMLAYCKVEPNNIIEELKNVSDKNIGKLIKDILNLKYEEKENLCLQYLKNSNGEYNNDIIMLLSSLYMKNRYGNKACNEMKEISTEMVRGISMLKSGKIDEAEKIYLSVIDRNKYTLNAYLSLGYIYLRTSKSDKAFEILNRLLEINPCDEKAKDMLKYIK